MRACLLRTLVLIAALSLAVPAFAGVDLDRKIEVNKIINMLGFTPDFNAVAVTGETEPNNSCAAPDVADIYADDTSGAISPAGDEDWYSFSGNAGDCVTLATSSYNGSTTDTQIYLYDAAGCGVPANWLIWDDDDGPGLFSLIDGYELPAAGTYYVRVKHYSASGTGAYLLTASSTACPNPPTNDTCATAEALACNSSVHGSTDLGTNDIEDADESCLEYGGLGPDVFYSVEVAAGFTLSAVLTPTDWDPALWFVTDCDDENSCVAGVDSGFFNDPETLSWTNLSATPVTIYVVVDSWSLTASGEFDLSVSCDQTVSVSPSSWGAVKSKY